MKWWGESKNPEDEAEEIIYGAFDKQDKDYGKRVQELRNRIILAQRRQKQVELSRKPGDNSNLYNQARWQEAELLYAEIQTREHRQQAVPLAEYSNVVQLFESALS